MKENVVFGIYLSHNMKRWIIKSLKTTELQTLPADEGSNREKQIYLGVDSFIHNNMTWRRRAYFVAICKIYFQSESLLIELFFT